MFLVMLKRAGDDDIVPVLQSGLSPESVMTAVALKHCDSAEDIHSVYEFDFKAMNCLWSRREKEDREIAEMFEQFQGIG